MPKLLIGLLSVPLALSALHSASSSQPSGNPQLIRAASSIMDYRLNWLEDSTQFSACAIYEATGRSASFPEGLAPGVLRGLDRVTEPCAEAEHTPPHQNQRFIRVDSITIRGDTAYGFVTVQKGEQRFREEYTMARVLPDRWGLAEVRATSFYREYPERPSR